MLDPVPKVEVAELVGRNLVRTTHIHVDWVSHLVPPSHALDTKRARSVHPVDNLERLGLEVLVRQF